jgi:hypothetical protein
MVGYLPQYSVNNENNFKFWSERGMYWFYNNVCYLLYICIRLFIICSGTVMGLYITLFCIMRIRVYMILCCVGIHLTNFCFLANTFWKYLICACEWIYYIGFNLLLFYFPRAYKQCVIYFYFTFYFFII